VQSHAEGQFASGINVVEVYATVTDRAGSLVQGLTASDFLVTEDGRPQHITTFAAGAFPLAVALAIDRSFSMGDRLPVARSAARAFVGALRPDDRVMVVAIGSDTEVVAPLTADRSAAMAAIDRIDRWGTTPLYDATIEAIRAIQPASGRRALVLVSDGTDRYSRASSGQMLEQARRADVLVYAVAVGPARPPIFSELAAATGGRSFFQKTPAALQDTMADIARELRFQYLIGYVPAPVPAGAPEWRSIAVAVDRPDAVVRAREGYWSR
jgi:Ca-activated chloride channel homolog